MNIASTQPNKEPEITAIPFERPIVQAVDALVLFAKHKASPNKIIESNSDWEVVSYIYKMYETFFPKSAKLFQDTMKQTRNRQTIKGGKRLSISKEGDASVQHQMNLPFEFHSMIKAIYPNQKLTKDFTRELFKRMPQLRVAEKLWRYCSPVY